MLQDAWNAAGGVKYHFRARRHRTQLWAAFRAELDVWFERWRPAARCLTIVGPSGGYCLPLKLAARFERIVCYEPDPIARFVLARRLRALPGERRVTLIARDAWVAPLLRGGAPTIDALAPDTALLFSNFIGQLMFLVPDASWADYQETWRAKVWPLLESVPWASFHDRLSGPIAPIIDPADCRGPRATDSRALRWYSEHARGELLDHASAELLPAGAQYGYFHWPLTDEQHHLIEAVISKSVSRPLP